MRRLALKAVQDKLTGGRADGMSEEDIAKKHDVSVDHIEDQIEKGVQVEMEHTNDSLLSKEIAKDHLVESPDYYTHLEEMEKKFEGGQATGDKQDLVKTTEVREKDIPVKDAMSALLFITRLAQASDQPMQWQEAVSDLPPVELAKSRTVIFNYVPGNPATLSITTPEVKAIDPTPLIEVKVEDINQIPMLIGTLRDEIRQKVKEYKAGSTTSSIKVSKVVKRPDGWHVMSEKGKHLGGPYDSRAQADKRLSQVEMFKHMKGMRRNTILLLRVAFDKSKWTYVNAEELKKLEQKFAGGAPITIKDLIPVIGVDAAATLNVTTDLTPQQIAKELIFTGRNALQIKEELAWKGYGEKPSAIELRRRQKSKPTGETI